MDQLVVKVLVGLSGWLLVAGFGGGGLARADTGRTPASLGTPAAFAQPPVALQPPSDIPLEPPTAETSPSEPDESAADEPPTYGRHYGYYTVAADLLWAATAAMLYKGGVNDAAWGLALMGYVGAGGVVHGLHDNDRSMVASVGLRAGMPLVGAGLGMFVAGGGGDPVISIVRGIIRGLVAGAAGAFIIDWTLLSRERIDLKDNDKPEAPSRYYSIIPQLAPTRGGATIGVAGSF